MIIPNNSTFKVNLFQPIKDVLRYTGIFSNDDEKNKMLLVQPTNNNRWSLSKFFSKKNTLNSEQEGTIQQRVHSDEKSNKEHKTIKYTKYFSKERNENSFFQNR